MRSPFILFYFLACFYCSYAQSAPYQLIYEGEKVGLVDEAGTVLIPAEYEGLGWTNGQNLPVNQLIGFKKDNLWGILSLENEVVVANVYSKLYPAKSGFFVASKRGKYSKRDFLGLITATGKEVLPFNYSSIELLGLRAIVGTYSGRSYSYGIVDFSNKSIVPINYKDIKPLGNLRFAVRDFNNQMAIFSENGNALTPFELDSISNFRNGYAITYSNHLRGVVDSNGIVVSAPEFKTIVLEDPIRQKDFPQWQVIDRREIIATYHFDEVEPMEEDLYKVSANDKQWVINSDGDALTPTSNNFIFKDENENYLFKRTGSWGIMKSDNSLLFEAQFDSIVQANNNYLVLDDGSWQVFDKFGIKKSQQEYENVLQNWAHYISVKKNGKWGLIDQSGTEVIYCVYQELGAINFNKIVVKFHGQYGVINKVGDWVVTPQKDRITILNNDLYLKNGSKLTTLKNFDGETIYFTSNEIDIEDQYLLEHLEGGGLWKIDFNGRIVNRELPQQKFQEIRASSEGLFAVKINNRFGFVDNQNRLLVANRYENVGDFHDGMAAVKLLGKWGFIDKNEQLVIQPQYIKVGNFSNGVVAVKNSKGMGIINKEGKPLSRFDYDEVKLQENGKFLIQKNGKFGLLAQDGSLLILAKYDYLEELPNGYVKASLFGKYGVLTDLGVDVIPIIYDKLTFDARFNYYLVMKKSDWENLSN